MNEKQLRALFADMSMEEKAGQLLLLDCSFLREDVPFATGPTGSFALTEEDRRLCGSVQSIYGAKKTKRLQEEFMRSHPHHIPLLFMLDIINGFRTAFPIPLAQGCTFNPELTRHAAQMSASEAAAAGMHMTFSPMADLVTDCRWGRVMESTGEDPCLNSDFAAAMVRGYQGNDTAGKDTLASCVKHFAGYGLPTAGREYSTVEISQRTLFEDHLPAYKAAIEAGCKGVMTAFNTLDRVPCTANRSLMRGTLRGEMRFNGVLISDYNAIEELIAHGVAENCAQAARIAMETGVDLDMASPCYARNVCTLIEDGIISEALLDEAAWRILTLKNDLGLFENPFKGADELREASVTLCAGHRAFARELAAKSFVLLKNEEAMLPLKKESNTAFIGPYAESKALHGAWSHIAHEEDAVTLRDAVEREGAAAVFEKGCGILQAGTVVQGFSGPWTEGADAQDEVLVQRAIKAAESAETVVLCLGEQRLQSGEGGSRADVSLPQHQRELIRRVHAVNSNIVCIVFCGRPLVLTDIEPLCKAILIAWFPGTEGGNALADVLYGNAEPCGRLTMAFPRSVGQLPMTYRELRSGRPLLPNSAPTRFVSKYQDCANTPLYPFGFGLGYTSFNCSLPLLSCHELYAGGAIDVRVTVANKGRRSGRQVIQLYICDKCGSVSRPVRELKGFQTVELDAGESREVMFTIEEPMLRFYGIDMHYQSEPGDFTVYVGFDSTTQNGADFTLCLE